MYQVDTTKLKKKSNVLHEHDEHFCKKNVKSSPCSAPQWARKIKKSRPRKLVKSNKSILWKKILGQIKFFAISKMAKNQFLNWEKV